MGIINEILYVLLIGSSGAMIWAFIMGIVLLFSKKPTKFIWKVFAILFIVALLSYMGISLL